MVCTSRCSWRRPSAGSLPSWSGGCSGSARQLRAWSPARPSPNRPDDAPDLTRHAQAGPGTSPTPSAQPPVRRCSGLGDRRQRSMTLRRIVLEVGVLVFGPLVVTATIGLLAGYALGIHMLERGRVLVVRRLILLLHDVPPG